MDFSRPKPRRPSEPALPMINVVFLLLIFFLMSAQIVTPPPFELTPPASENGNPPSARLRLQIAPDGSLALADATNDAVWARLESLLPSAEDTLLIRADATLPAAELAAVLARVSAIGFERIELATVPR